MDSVRLDKWLWAARFFKTRSLAKRAVDAGQVRVDGKRVKPARTITIDDCLVIQRGEQRMEVTVVGMNDRRRSASEAQQLYCETEESQALRLIHNQQRAAKAARPRKPDKKSRRVLSRLKRADTL